MRGQRRRLAIAVVLTVADVWAASNYCGVIWRTISQHPLARAAFLGLLWLWVSSLAVLWLHVAYELCQALRERDSSPAFDTVMVAAEPQRESHV